MMVARVKIKSLIKPKLMPFVAGLGGEAMLRDFYSSFQTTVIKKVSPPFNVHLEMTSTCENRGLFLRIRTEILS
jgi:hypothetical protein